MARVGAALRAVARALAGSGAILILLLAWESVARSGAVTAYMLPPLSEVIARIARDAASGDLAVNAALTLYRAGLP
jgi:ABC-type nitrate/sulfonate/bicarbonate transport system permease component